MNVNNSSMITYTIIVLLLIGIKLLFLVFPVRLRTEDQGTAFAWTTLIAIAIFGGLGLFLSHKAGFPDLWDPKVDNFHRFGIPILVGILYGIITVMKDIRKPAEHPLAVDENIHVELPLSIPFYTYGGIFLEILLRLFPIPLLTWFFSTLLLRGNLQTEVFWLAAILTSLYEPMPYMSESIKAKKYLEAAGILISPLFIANVIAAGFLRAYGFLAPLVMRLSFYLVWHVIYGGIFFTPKSQRMSH
jgi:hypothetical protein